MFIKYYYNNNFNFELLLFFAGDLKKFLFWFLAIYSVKIFFFKNINFTYFYV